MPQTCHWLLRLLLDMPPTCHLLLGLHYWTCHLLLGLLVDMVLGEGIIGNGFGGGGSVKSCDFWVFVGG